MGGQAGMRNSPGMQYAQLNDNYLFWSEENLRWSNDDDDYDDNEDNRGGVEKPLQEFDVSKLDSVDIISLVCAKKSLLYNLLILKFRHYFT